MSIRPGEWQPLGELRAGLVECVPQLQAARDPGEVPRMLPAVRTDEWQAVVFDEKIVRPAAEDPAHGEYENGRRYVLMSQLTGTELAAAWPAIPRPHQDRVASQAGELLAALHSLDPGPLHAILGPADWDGFLAGCETLGIPLSRSTEKVRSGSSAHTAALAE